MNAIYLHPVDGFTFLENVPEKPTKTNDVISNEYAWADYYTALDKVIKNRLVIGNPEQIERLIGKKTVGELYPWPGTYKKEFEPQPNHPTAYGIDIIRLIAPEPVNSSMSEKEAYNFLRSPDKYLRLSIGPRQALEMCQKDAIEIIEDLKNTLIEISHWGEYNGDYKQHAINAINRHFSEPVVSQDQEEQRTTLERSM